MKYILSTSAIVFMSTMCYSEESKHWYEVRVKEFVNGESYRYQGSSHLTLIELGEKLKDKEPILLYELIAWNSNKKTIPWSEYDKNVVGQIMIMPENVLSILPLKGDPKEGDK